MNERQRWRKIGEYNAKRFDRDSRRRITTSQEISLDFSKHPFVGLLFALLILSTVMPRANAASSTRQASEDTLEPCGENLARYLPKHLEKFALQISTFMKATDCTDVANVTGFFNKLNAKSYGSELCMFFASDKDCRKLFKLEDTRELIPLTVDPDERRVTLVNEGQYGIVSTEETIVTSKISFCVGVAIIHPQLDEVFLMHVNAENIKAYDEFLKQKSSQNPFAEMETFLTQKKSGWIASSVSGSVANSAYVRVLLDSSGVTEVSAKLNTHWAMSSDKSVLDGGSLVIHKGNVHTLKNHQQFKNRISLLEKSRKNKPMLLEPCQKAEQTVARMDL